jgi:hypothetical protein
VSAFVMFHSCMFLHCSFYSGSLQRPQSAPTKRHAARGSCLSCHSSQLTATDAARPPLGSINVRCDSGAQESDLVRMM